MQGESSAEYVAELQKLPQDWNYGDFCVTNNERQVGAWSKW